MSESRVKLAGLRNVSKVARMQTKIFEMELTHQFPNLSVPIFESIPELFQTSFLYIHDGNRNKCNELDCYLDFQLLSHKPP